MKTSFYACVMTLGIALVAATSVKAASPTISFAGYEWTVRSGQGGPGPNTWDETNAWLDASGHLHLKIRVRDGRWSCAEVTMQKKLGFGRYQFQVEGRIDQFDDHVVLGLFNYPTREVGGDATHEIDIEFARWGNPKFPIGNYTVWPVEKALKPTSHTFSFQLAGSGSTHRFDWSPGHIDYRSFQGVPEDEAKEIARWSFVPEDPPQRIAQRPMPVHLNLWLFQGHPPKDGKEVEVVIRDFRFTPR